MGIKNLKEGDIFTYRLDKNALFTAIFINYQNEYLSLIDIANHNSHLDYEIPAADKLSLEEHSVEVYEVVGHIDVFKPLYSKYPELFV